MTREEAQKFVSSLQGIWRASTYNPMEPVVSINNVVDALNALVEGEKFAVEVEQGIVRFSSPNLTSI